MLYRYNVFLYCICSTPIKKNAKKNNTKRTTKQKHNLNKKKIKRNLHGTPRSYLAYINQNFVQHLLVFDFH
jgi:hypothetical protein